MKKVFNRKNIPIFLVLIVAAVFRLYRIQDYLTFLGDEGRDVLIVREILHGQLTFIGPRASAADFYTGPIYYYMMAPFLFLSNYNPVGPAIMIALLGIATVYLIYRFGKEWLGYPAAIVAASLYAISPLVIAYSRSSWNPNPMPFFTLLILYLLYRGIQKPTIKLFILIGILYAVAFQLHYIETFVGVIIFVFVFLGNLMNRKKDIVVKLLKQYLSIAFGFIIGISPFLAFEIKNGFPNTKTVSNFIINGDPTAADITKTTFLEKVWDIFFRLFGRLILHFPPPEQLQNFDKNLILVWTIAVIVLAAASIIAIIKIKDKLVKLLLSLWLFFGIVLFGFYHKPIYDYYFEFMFPLPFLLVGSLFAFFYSQKNNLIKFAAVGFVLIIVLVNLLGSPFSSEPNRQYNQAKIISEFILKEAGDKPFNFALITGGNSDHGYRYIFEVQGHPSTTILTLVEDPERKTVTDQLFVLCEQNPCEPLGHSLWEVAGFGRAEIAGEWPVSIFKVYKLVHYKEKK